MKHQTILALALLVLLTSNHSIAVELGRGCSPNVIDLRNGVTCVPPKTCKAFTLACNKQTCTQLISTGNCVPDCSGREIRATDECQIKQDDCDEKECTRDKDEYNVDCPKELPCPKKKECNPSACMQSNLNGKCDRIYSPIKCSFIHTCHVEYSPCPCETTCRCTSPGRASKPTQDKPCCPFATEIDTKDGSKCCVGKSGICYTNEDCCDDFCVFPADQKPGQRSGHCAQTL